MTRGSLETVITLSFIKPPMRFDSFTVAGLPGVVLRPIDHSDIPNWYAYLALPHVIEHTSWNLATADDLNPLVDWYNSDDPASAIRFAIADRSTNSLIGTVGFHTISKANHSAELAIDVHPSHWRRGIAKHCCEAAAEWGFKNQQFVRVQATALDTNVASYRLLEKCGLLLEGKLKSYRMVRGTPRDFFMFAAVSGSRGGTA